MISVFGEAGSERSVLSMKQEWYEYNSKIHERGELGRVEVTGEWTQSEGFMMMNSGQSRSTFADCSFIYNNGSKVSCL